MSIFYRTSALFLLTAPDVQPSASQSQIKVNTAVLTWFIWTFLTFVETPGRPNGPTALLLLGEARQSLSTLEHYTQNMDEEKKDRLRLIQVCVF